MATGGLNTLATEVKHGEKILPERKVIRLWAGWMLIMGSKASDFSKESGIVEVAGPIFCDVFFSERLLPSSVDLKVVMSPSSNEFCLMSSVANADFKAKLIEAYLKV